MEAREFAEQNQGAIVDFETYDMVSGAFAWTRGRLVGWKEPGGMAWFPSPAKILVEPENTKRFGARRDYETQGFMEGYWWMRPTDHFCEAEVDKIRVVRPETKRGWIVWPHRCQECGQPAQQLFNMVDCSNWRCRHYR